MEERYVTATGFWLWLLKRINADAITMPWRTVYFANPEWQDDYGLMIHEQVHLDQIRLDGPILFSIRYVWWTLRYGYWNNPYEVKARYIEACVMAVKDYKPHTEPAP